METNNFSRRSFVKTSSAITASTILTAPNIARAVENDKVLKIGLVGIGGRGSGAAAQAMNADDHVALTAIGDLFEDRIKLRSRILKARGKSKYQVTPETTFTGFDAYKKVIDSGVDVVILTSPPSFRPQHLEYAVEKGVHCFFEKPVAVDAPGVRKVIELAKKAKEKNLGFMSGFCWRHHFPKREVFGRILDGALGDVHAMYSTYNGGEVWKKTREDGWGDLEAQLRNWNAHLWLSGDSIVEQAVHCIDMMQWAMGDETPIEAEGSGGRQVYDDPDKYGNIFDHFACVYQWQNGARGYHFSRQQNGTVGSYEVELYGTKGSSSAKNRHTIIAGDDSWRYRGENNDMYQTEHDELFASIRNANPFNDGEKSAHSTMVAILGRMASYTGQKITYEDALNSKEDLTPPHMDWDKGLEVPQPPVPGITRFV
ncbi:MAG: Gfo/Idh/MocA family oxidoreductase [Verrucomicrobiota bacterium]|nr:Gfo/Idh/MocA family oxidoreductase [Verrucomicrobiota bacterium]